MGKLVINERCKKLLSLSAPCGVAALSVSTLAVGNLNHKFLHKIITKCFVFFNMTPEENCGQPVILQIFKIGFFVPERSYSDIQRIERKPWRSLALANHQ